MTEHQLEILDLFSRGAVTAIPQARGLVAALLSEVDRLQSDRSMRMERLRDELTWTEAALNALANAAGVDFGTARADLERAAGKPEIDGVSGAYRYAASLVERAVDRAGQKAEAELRARCLPVPAPGVRVGGRESGSVKISSDISCATVDGVP